MFKHHTIRVAGVAAFATALVGGVLTGLGVRLGSPCPAIRSGLIAPGGANCESAAAAYAAAWLDGNHRSATTSPTSSSAAQGRTSSGPMPATTTSTALAALTSCAWARATTAVRAATATMPSMASCRTTWSGAKPVVDHLVDGGPNVDLCNGGPGFDTFFQLLDRLGER